MSDEYTPTTEYVRYAYATRMAPMLDSERYAKFDRWLNEVKAEVREQAAQRIYEALTLGGHGDDVDAGLHLATEIVRGM